MLHEKDNHGRANDSQYVVHYLAYFYITMSYAHSPYRYEERAPIKAGSPNIPVLVHVVAMCNEFQGILSLL